MSDCVICGGPERCLAHDECVHCGAAVESGTVPRGYAPAHEHNDCEGHDWFMSGAAVAFGLLGMAEAIRVRTCPLRTYVSAEDVDQIRKDLLAYDFGSEAHDRSKAE